ncbi:MAG: GDSL-type esterase/lipase family protein [Deltaproteobacteria bacterium]|nr:GDSL-type esterase/lipase family protein [Deltaproteobacteria bacterium]
MSVAVSIVVIGLLEVTTRAAEPGGERFVRFLFHAKLVVDRWRFLERKQADLYLENKTLDSAPTMRPNQVDVEEPEWDMPVFDRSPRPFVVRTNAWGFRERPIPDKAPGRRRVFVFGDSVPFGKGVRARERYSTLMQNLLPADVEVFNVAKMGITTRGMRQELETVLTLEPDAILMQVSSNDLDQTLWRVVKGAGGPNRALYIAMSLLSNSRALSYATFTIVGDPWYEKIARAKKRVRRDYREPMESFLDACRKRGIPVAVVFTPLATGVYYGDHVANICAAHRESCVGSLRVRFDDPERWIADWPIKRMVAEATVDFADETQASYGFPEGSADTLFPYRLFFDDIVHPSTLGHELIAAQAAAFVESTLLPRIPRIPADTAAPVLPLTPE